MSFNFMAAVTICNDCGTPKNKVSHCFHCFPMYWYLHRRYLNPVLAQSLWGLWILVHTRFVWALWASLAGKGVILNAILPLIPSCWGFSFALGRGVSFFGGIQHSPVENCSAVSCSFKVLTGEDEFISFYSSILHHKCNSLSEVAISSLIFASLQSDLEMDEQQQAEEQQ